MATDTSSQKRTKHIRVKAQFVNDAFDKGIISLEWVPTEANPSDIFTKPLESHLFTKHRSTITGRKRNDQYWLSAPMSQSPNKKKTSKTTQRKTQSERKEEDGHAN